MNYQSAALVFRALRQLRGGLPKRERDQEGGKRRREMEEERIETRKLRKSNYVTFEITLEEYPHHKVTHYSF